MQFSKSEVRHIETGKNTLEIILGSVMDYYANSIDNRIFDVIKDNFILSGGAIASAIQGQSVNDFDFYLKPNKDKSVFEKFENPIGLFYHAVKEIDPKYMEMTDKTDGKVITANAITLKKDVQLIKIIGFEDRKKSFDFVHCLPYYDWDKLYISRQQYDSIVKKELIPNEGIEPKKHRIDKFKKRGWTTPI